MLRFLLLFCIFPCLGYCQHTVKLTVGSAPFQLYTNYPINGIDSIRIEQFKFYVGNQRGDFQLVDASDTTTFSLPFTDKVLLIGMDSLANTSGKLDGAFDPLLGMYWAWNTGYTQLKCKGIYQIAGKHIPFEYHLGGYKYPYATSLQKWIRLEQNTLGIQLDSLLTHLPVLDQPRMMLPGPMARALFVRFTEGFQ